jgi:hypothetical protein
MGCAHLLNPVGDEMVIEKTEVKTSKRGGARPNSGGRREGSGRKKGTPNKATADIKALAQQYGPQAIETLATLMQSADSAQAQIAAAKELLDRGYGKATQLTEVTGKDGSALAWQFMIGRAGTEK